MLIKGQLFYSKFKTNMDGMERIKIIFKLFENFGNKFKLQIFQNIMLIGFKTFKNAIGKVPILVLIMELDKFSGLLQEKWSQPVTY